MQNEGPNGAKLGDHTQTDEQRTKLAELLKPVRISTGGDV